MRILVAEDDKSLNKIIVRRLKESGYIVDSCFDGETALDYLKYSEYDCAIMDWMMPGMEGITVIQKYRISGGKTPVLMLTAKDSISNRVEGLDCGADDYLIKPFSFEELLARIRVILRREPSGGTCILAISNLTLNTASHLVIRGDKEINLTSKEFALLEYFLRNKGIVLSREQISDHVWDYDFTYDSNVVDVYVRYLRNKIDKGFEHPLIHTVRGYGYVLKEMK